METINSLFRVVKSINGVVNKNNKMLLVKTRVATIDRIKIMSNVPREGRFTKSICHVVKKSSLLYRKSRYENCPN